ncbi:hypothetical protein CCR75_008762 [Bremia lactucae]|uniref:RxLR effector protein n=1 Tax=Bremia lactucae TaxID=4779 RepID=A0A976FLP8_BRELC|nr:hypothetical protein CCR75_008762 [Bremia lactucae]
MHLNHVVAIFLVGVVTCFTETIEGSKRRSEIIREHLAYPVDVAIGSRALRHTVASEVKDKGDTGPDLEEERAWWENAVQELRWRVKGPGDFFKSLDAVRKGKDLHTDRSFQWWLHRAAQFRNGYNGFDTSFLKVLQQETSYEQQAKLFVWLQYSNFYRDMNAFAKDQLLIMEANPASRHAVYEAWLQDGKTPGDICDSSRIGLNFESWLGYVVYYRSKGNQFTNEDILKTLTSQDLIKEAVKKLILLPGKKAN